ncbi:MAG: hypothetical protein D6812_13265, partial [Deltaproteobacteria bacterium]
MRFKISRFCRDTIEDPLRPVGSRGGRSLDRSEVQGRMTMKRSVVAAIVVVVLGFPAMLSAQIGYYAEQGEFSVDLPVLEGTKSLAEFYSYNTPAGASSNTGLEIAELSQF